MTVIILRVDAPVNVPSNVTDAVFDESSISNANCCVATYLRTVLSGGTPGVNIATQQFAVEILDSSKTASVTCLGSFTGASTRSVVTVTPYLM